MVGLWTTYLSFLRKAHFSTIEVFPNAFEPTEFLYVMRGRGNDVIAPSSQLLQLYRTGEFNWEKYADCYRAMLSCGSQRKWMQQVGERAKHVNVVLICYEKPPKHCHRFILAHLIAETFDNPCEYKGELTEEHLKRYDSSNPKIRT